MKKFLALFLALVMMISFAACGDTQQPNSKTGKLATNKALKFKTFEEISTAVAEDETAVVAEMQEKIEKINADIDEDYDVYLKTVPSIEEWYAYSLTTAKEFYSRMRDYTIAYYKLIAKEVGLKEYRDWNRAIEDCYDLWNDTLEDFYDDWNDLYDDLYDEYSDIIDYGYDKYDYDQVSDVWDAMYDLHSDSWDDMYDEYSDAWEDLYDDYGDVFDGFYDDEDDVDKILKTDTSAENTTKESEEKATKKSEKKADIKENKEVDYKEFWDSYEEFYDEYLEFMKSYDASDISMLSKYADLMKKYSEFAEKAEARKGKEMSAEESAYALEVETRVANKLAKASLN